MEFIVATIAIVALVWSPVLLARTSLTLSGVVFLVLANCFGLEFLSIDIGPINMSIERFFLLALPVAYVVQRRLGRLDPKPFAANEWLLIAFTGLLVVSAFTHDWRAATASSGPVIQHLINGYLTPLVIFVLVRNAKIGERDLRSVYTGFVIFGAYLAFTGICEALGVWGLVFPKYIADPEIGLHFGRARGPMVHAVTYGVALATSVFCGWLLWPKASRAVQFLLFVLLPVALAALFFSKTRSVWMGFAAGTGLLMLTRLRGAWRPLAFGSVAAAGLLVVALNFDRIMAFDRKDNTAAQTRESVEARGSFLYVSWLMFQDRPLLGFGFGQFPNEKLPYLSDRATDLQLEAIRPWAHHNTYLSLLAELGIVGLALFVAVLIGWARDGWRLWRTADAPDWVRGQGALMLAVLAMYATQCLFHEMSFTTRDHSLVYFFAALTSALASVSLKQQPARADARSSTLVPVRTRSIASAS
jgi:O-antigen ligase